MFPLRVAVRTRIPTQTPSLYLIPDRVQLHIKELSRGHAKHTLLPSVQQPFGCGHDGRTPLRNFRAICSKNDSDRSYSRKFGLGSHAWILVTSTPLWNTRNSMRILLMYLPVRTSSIAKMGGWNHQFGYVCPSTKTKMPESSAAELESEGFFHQDIIDVISSVYRSDAVRSFEHVPFKSFWRSSEDSPPECLYGEIFSSDAMLDADNDICTICLENDLDESDLEAISVPLLFYSDSTHLANFGNASCWPVYLLFGSQSKYIRAMPTSSACHHIAYMPEVSHIQNMYTNIS